MSPHVPSTRSNLASAVPVRTKSPALQANASRVNVTSAVARGLKFWTMERFCRQPARSLHVALSAAVVLEAPGGDGELLMVRSNPVIGTGLAGGKPVWPVIVPIQRPTSDRTETCLVAAELFDPARASTVTPKFPVCVYAWFADGVLVVVDVPSPNCHRNCTPLGNVPVASKEKSVL